MKGSIVGLGILVLVIGVILCLYPVEYTYSILGTPIRTWIEYPYREYGFILFVVGVVVLVVGLAIPKQVEERPSPRPSRQLIPKARFCSQCGKLVSIEAKFCPNCGKEMKTD
jgi:ribosomal protein S27AE